MLNEGQRSQCYATEHVAQMVCFLPLFTHFLAALSIWE